MIEPTITTGPRSISLSYDGTGITVHCRRLRESGDNIAGELEILADIPSVPHNLHIPSNYNFTTSVTRARLAKELAEKSKALPWLELLEAVSQRVISYVRQLEDCETWTAYDDAIEPEYLCYPFLPENEFSIIFGEGGSGKSLFALLLYMCVSIPYSDNPYNLRVDKCYPGLYLDWESSAKRTRWNIKKIYSGGSLDAPTFHYAHMTRTLADSIDQVENMIAKLGGVGFVILDSLGAAAGGDLNATEPAFKLVQAVRELTRSNITVLAIGHTAKNQEPRAKRSVYGNVYYSNEARTIWELRRAESTEESITEVGLFHNKTNISAYLAPFGYKIKFSPIAITFEHQNVKNVADFVVMLKLQDRIYAAWETGPKTLAELKELTGASGGSLSVTLNRLKNKGRASYSQSEKKWSKIATVGSGILTS